MGCFFGFFSSVKSKSISSKKNNKEVLAEKIDSITFEGKKYLVTYSTKVSKNTAKVNSELKIELTSNSEKKLLSVVSYVAELKTNGVMVENPTKGGDIKQFCTLIPKGESVFISKIAFKDANGNVIENQVPGFKLTRLE